MQPAAASNARSNIFRRVVQCSNHSASQQLN
jgi:hypothetical protein